jgi:hypothetical protein
MKGSVEIDRRHKPQWRQIRQVDGTELAPALQEKSRRHLMPPIENAKAFSASLGAAQRPFEIVRAQFLYNDKRPARTWCRAGRSRGIGRRDQAPMRRIRRVPARR